MDTVYVLLPHPQDDNIESLLVHKQNKTKQKNQNKTKQTYSHKIFSNHFRFHRRFCKIHVGEDLNHISTINNLKISVRPFSSFNVSCL